MLILKKFIFNLLFHKKKCYSSVKKEGGKRQKLARIVHTSRASKKYIYLSLFRGKGKKILQPERRKRRIRFVRLINFQEGKWRRSFISLARISKACEDKKSLPPLFIPSTAYRDPYRFSNSRKFPPPKKTVLRDKGIVGLSTEECVNFESTAVRSSQGTLYIYIGIFRDASLSRFKREEFVGGILQGRFGRGNLGVKFWMDWD